MTAHWADIVAHWDAVICDLSAIHGIDLYDPAVLASPWPGIRVRIHGLIDDPTSRLFRALTRG